MPSETVQVPRQWLIKALDTLTAIDALIDGEKAVNPAAFNSMLKSDIDWLATAANVMLLESE